MNKNTPELDAVKDTAKAVLNNTGQTIDLMLAKSAELLGMQADASRAMMERHAAHLDVCRRADSQGAMMALQEKYAKAEVEHMRELASKVAELTDAAFMDFSSLGDNNRNVSGEFVADALEQAAHIASETAGAPFGQLFSSFLQGQSEAFRSFDRMVEKTLETQRESMAKLRESLSAAAAQAAPAKKGK